MASIDVKIKTDNTLPQNVKSLLQISSSLGNSNDPSTTVSLGLCTTVISKDVVEKLGKRLEQICSQCEVTTTTIDDIGCVLYGSITGLQKAEQQIKSYEAENPNDIEKEKLSSGKKIWSSTVKCDPVNSKSNVKAVRTDVSSTYSGRIAKQKSTRKAKKVEVCDTKSEDCSFGDDTNIQSINDIVNSMLEKAKASKRLSLCETTVDISAELSDKGECLDLDESFEYTYGEDTDEDPSGMSLNPEMDTRNNKQTIKPLENHPETSIKNFVKKGAKDLFVCIFCKYYSVQRTRLVTHTKKVHSKVMCMFCQICFDQEKCLEKHILGCQSLPKSENIPQKPKKRKTEQNEYYMWKCQVCPTTLPTKQLLSIHTKKMHSEIDVSNCKNNIKQVKVTTDFTYDDEDDDDDDDEDEGNKATLSDIHDIDHKIDAEQRNKMKFYVEKAASKRFKCCLCKYTASNEAALFKHVQYCSKSGFVYCDSDLINKRMTVEEVAEATGTSIDVLEDIIALYPDNLKHKFNCSVCGYISSKSGVDRHKMRTHQGEETEQCQFCDLKFRREWMLNSHVRSHFDKDTGNLLQHTLKTSGEQKENVDKCEICNLVIRNRFLEGHKTRHHFPERGYQCIICLLIFVEKSSIVSHFVQHFTTERKKAKPKDVSLGNNKTKIKKIERNIEETEIEKTEIKMETNSGSFLCEYCGNPFNTGALLGRHKKSCSLKMAEINFSYSDMNMGFDLDKLQAASAKFPVAYKYIHRCPQCTYTSTTKGLEKHIVRSHRKPTISCPVCPRTFARVWQIKAHMRGSHQNIEIDNILNVKFKSPNDPHDSNGQQNLVRCPECSQECSKRSLDVHMLLHKADCKLFCIICHKNCISLPMLTIHLASHFDPKSGELKVPVNDKYIKIKERQFKTGHQITSHYINEGSAADTGEIICEQCGQGFPNASKLAFHLNSHKRDEEKDYQTVYIDEEVAVKCVCLEGICENNCAGKKEYIREKRYVCPYEECNSVQRKAYLLDRHIKIIHLKETVCFCETCGKQYNCVKNLQNHIKKAHMQQLDFQCQICPQRFVDRSKLKYHMDTHRPHSERSDVAPCKICGKVLIKKYLKYHVNQHTGHRPFECHICLKRFPYRAGLHRHMIYLHNKLTPYVCKFPGCDAAFKVPARLRYHTTIHTGKSNHQCDFCKKVFTQGGSLKKHQQLHCAQLEDSKRSIRLSSVLEENENLKINKTKKAESKENKPEAIESILEYKQGILQEVYQQIYMCGVCQLTFQDISEIEAHLATHEVSSTTTTEEDNNSTDLLMPC